MIILAVCAGLLSLHTDLLKASVINVPADYDSIQTAVNSASSGDTVLIAPGTYVQSSLIVDKHLVLTSNYIYTRNQADIDNTIIKATAEAKTQWFKVRAQNSVIYGLSIYGNTEHSLVIRTPYAEIVHCNFFGGKDQISFEKSGGYIGYCYIEGAGDDGIDADNSIDWIIEYNTIVNAHQDGIEIRLQDKSAPLTTHIFRYNTVINSRQSGIQLINYAGDSYRRFEIYGNIFKDCQGAGVSCMFDQKSSENYNGSDMEETAIIYNNTFDGCNYAITGAPHLIILNNIIANCRTMGIGRGIHVTDENDRSIVDFCNFYNNPTDRSADVTTGPDLFSYNPQFTDSTTYALSPGSKCIDAGTRQYTWNGEMVLDLPESQYAGISPDLGAAEYYPEVGIETKQRYSLDQNYPNPFNSSTLITYQIDHPGRVQLDIYNILGRKMARLVDGFQPAGHYEVRFSGEGLPSGIYVYTLDHGLRVSARKFALIR